jgi:hypothetical protein
MLRLRTCRICISRQILLKSNEVLHNKKDGTSITHEQWYLRVLLKQKVV